MATFEADTILRLKRPTESPELGLSSSASLSNADEGFIEKFRNVAFESNSDVNAAFKESAGSQVSGAGLPLRPYGGDCPYYIRNGTCKFGLNCRFNHPFKRSSLVPKAVKENVNDSSSMNYRKMVCKYYLSPGGCKYGVSCRYSHSKDELEVAVPELNFLGLPIRLGQQECPYYMRCGSCGYGARCVFHHPEPTSVGGFDSLKSTLDDKSMIQSGYCLGSSSSDSASLLLTGASQLDQAPWDSYPVSDRCPYQDDKSPYMAISSVAQGMQRHFDWNEYQASDSPHERSSQVYLHPGARVDVLGAKIFVQGEEFPERPDQPVCAYFLKTGDCKFKSACRFNHPKDCIHMPDVCALSEKGLPLRPGKKVCRHYELFGICKFGRPCLFDHPVDHKFATYPVWSTSEPASSRGTGSRTN